MGTVPCRGTKMVTDVLEFESYQGEAAIPVPLSTPPPNSTNQNPFLESHLFGSNLKLILGQIICFMLKRTKLQDKRRGIFMCFPLSSFPPTHLKLNPEQGGTYLELGFGKILHGSSDSQYSKDVPPGSLVQCGYIFPCKISHSHFWVYSKHYSVTITLCL